MARSCDSASNYTSPEIKPLIFCSADERVITWPCSRSFRAVIICKLQNPIINTIIANTHTHALMGFDQSLHICQQNGYEWDSTLNARRR